MRKRPRVATARNRPDGLENKMSAQNEVKEDWQERRDLVLAVRTRVSDQLGRLTNALVPEADPSMEELQRIEDLQFELGQLQEAFDEADQNWLTHSLGSDQNGVEQ